MPASGLVVESAVEFIHLQTQVVTETIKKKSNTDKDNFVNASNLLRLGPGHCECTLSEENVLCCTEPSHWLRDMVFNKVAYLSFQTAVKHLAPLGSRQD